MPDELLSIHDDGGDNGDDNDDGGDVTHGDDGVDCDENDDGDGGIDTCTACIDNMHRGSHIHGHVHMVAA